MILSIAKWTQRDFTRDAAISGKAQLLTISYSHYCEMARLGLDLMEMEYEEHGYAAGQHVLPLLKARVCGQEKIISTSSNVTTAHEATNPVNFDEDGQPKKKAGSRTGTPLLIMPDGNTYSDSWDILNSTGLKPIEERYKPLYDMYVGPLSRQVIYKFLMKQSNKNSWDKLMTEEGHGAMWSFLWNLGVGSRLTPFLGGTFAVEDDEAFQLAITRLRTAFDTITETRLKQSKGKYINGNEISAEDIALVALVSPVVSPPEFCKGRFRYILEELFDSDAEARAIRTEFREREVGKYCLDFYKEYGEMQ
jgi:glutathione S-transferase